MRFFANIETRVVFCKGFSNELLNSHFIQIGLSYLLIFNYSGTHLYFEDLDNKILNCIDNIPTISAFPSLEFGSFKNLINRDL